jgi:hypothetical protein
MKQKRRTRFGTWCARDINDETLIRYTVRIKDHTGNVRTEQFTSEDNVDRSMLGLLKYAWIESITGEKGKAWDVVLYTD